MSSRQQPGSVASARSCGTDAITWRQWRRSVGWPWSARSPIGVTGLLTAEIHLGGREDGWGLITQWVTSGYGALVFAKAVAFALLVWIGWWHRRATLPALAANQPAAFWRLAAGELLLMAATVGLAVALSRTP